MNENKKRFTILCVDDDPLSHTVLQSTLQDEYDIIESCNGKEGIESAQNSKPDMILLDINMPDMDGFTVIKFLKNHHDTAKIPVVFVSSLDDEFNEVYGLNTGAADYIIKPVKPGVLKARLRNLLDYFYPKGIIQENSSEDSYANNSQLKPEQVAGLAQSLQEVLREKELFLREDLRAAHVAQAIGIRPYHLQELLNRHLKTSFPELINKARIEFAINEMRSRPEHKIIDIMYESGFQTKSVFNRVFREITGMSPTEFKKTRIQPLSANDP